MLPSTSSAQSSAEIAEDATRFGGRIVSANRILLNGLSGFERALENESLIGRSLRPPAQLVMTGWLGAGNERVYPGREGGCSIARTSSTSPDAGSSIPAQMRRRVRARHEWTAPPQPDPRRGDRAV